MLFRTFSEIDLHELKRISDAIENRQKIPKIDEEAIVSNFEGHTIFSIFQEHIDVYEQIVQQMKEKEFEASEDFNGIDAEHPYLRRIHRILLTPTSDWLETQTLRDELEEES